MLLKSQWSLFRNPNLHVSINPHSSTNRRDEGHSLTVGTTLTHPYGFRGKMPFWDHQISSFIQLHDGSRVGLHFCFKSLMLLKLALLVDHEVSQMQPLSTQSFCPPGTPIIPPRLNPTLHLIMDIALSIPPTPDLLHYSDVSECIYTGPLKAWPRRTTSFADSKMLQNILT